MWLKIVTVFTVFTCVLADSCVKEKIKYEIARFTPTYETSKTDFNQDVIQNDKEAYYINITAPVKAFCKGSLNITVRTYHFWCDDMNLEEIEVGTFDNQKIVNQFRISGGNMKVLRTGTFRKLKFTEMTISQMQLKTIEKHAIDDMPDLTTLHLSHNEISILHPEAIVNTPILRWFDISDNKIKVLSSNMFRFLARDGIVGVGVSNNEIESIDPEAFEGLNIYTLGLDNNKLKELPDSLFTENKNMSEIHLVNNQLTSLSDAFFAVGSLRNVYLKGNIFDCKTVSKLDEMLKKGGFTNERRKRESIFQPPRLSYDNKNC